MANTKKNNAANTKYGAGYNKPAQGEETKKTEPDFTKTNQAGEFDHLNDEDINPSHGGVNFIGDKELLKDKIPEETLSKETVNLNELPLPGDDTLGEQPFNPGFNAGQQPAPEPNIDEPLPTEGESAYRMADAIHRTARKGVQKIPDLIAISEKTIDKLDEKGKINKHLLITDNALTNVQKSILQVTFEFNESLKPGFDIPEEWIQENNPLLASILKAKGAGISPAEQYGINCCILVGGILFATKQAYDSRTGFIDKLSAISAKMPSKPATVTNPETGQSAPVSEAAAPAPAAVEKTVVDESTLATERKQAADLIDRVKRKATITKKPVKKK